ncbi:MAG TPA: L-aspartate oxidase [Longimicrobiales bacterium]|nr:L-aspartate oxidase [Longimicrobiales bacterium]
MKRDSTDVLVIGSGMAGLTFALRAAEHGRVCVVTKKERAVSSTNYAQGGIAAVMSPDDSLDLHVRDTLVAGAGLCHLRAVEMLVQEGPARIRDLIDWGVQFSRSADRLSLGREGGHSRRRILHAGDLTGREIERALLEAVADHPHIRLIEDLQAVDLVAGTDADGATPRCAGALLLEHRTGELIHVTASLVLLATGGLGQAYRHTTNPDIATGDGVAMAYRAGVAVANLEFVQFHPTALYPAHERPFLISEAVRGEGAVLRRPDGSPLMDDVHPLGSLAPRDIVARAIDLHLKASGDDYVLLDLSPIEPAVIPARFPGIHAECAARGIDILREPIPVVPAAHYSCGGVLTDAAGRTSLAGLFAAGEVACTGVHGANRLASNSLLEAVVYSYRASLLVERELERAAGATHGRPDPQYETCRPPADAAASAGANAAEAAAIRDGMRDLMWDDAGIARSDARLAVALRELDRLRSRTESLFWTCVDTATVELRNLLEVSWLIVASARSRKESRGLHYNVDYPHRDNEQFLRDTVLTRARV